MTYYYGSGIVSTNKEDEVKNNNMKNYGVLIKYDNNVFFITFSEDGYKTAIDNDVLNFKAYNSKSKQDLEYLMSVFTKIFEEGSSENEKEGFKQL